MRIVDELIYRFTHTIEMPCLLPGVAPTGRHVEVALVVVVEFVDGKISGERIYWDQASVLAQLGLLDVGQLPVSGSDAARKVLNPAQELSNALIAGRSGSRGYRINGTVDDTRPADAANQCWRHA